MFALVPAPEKFVGELIFPIGTNAKNIFMRNRQNSHTTLKITKWARKSMYRDVLMWDKEIPPSDPNNFIRISAEPRF